MYSVSNSGVISTIESGFRSRSITWDSNARGYDTRYYIETLLNSAVVVIHGDLSLIAIHWMFDIVRIMVV